MDVKSSLSIPCQSHSSLSPVWALLISMSAFALACSPSDDPILPPLASTPLPILGIVDCYPAWSPTGYIAYFRTRTSTDGPPGIYMLRPDGTDNHLVFASRSAFLYDLRFSPDGSALALVQAGRICILHLENNKLEVLTEDGQAGSPDWSPSGEHIVFEKPFSQMTIIALHTGSSQALPVSGGDPRWSPRGEPIVFWSGGIAGGPLDIYSIHSDGTSLRRLTHSNFPAFSQFPRWANQGEQIFYTWKPSDPRSTETRIMNPDGSQQMTWATHLFNSQAFSPDSRQFVLIRAQNADSLGVLFLQDTDDPTRATLRQLTSFLPPSQTGEPIPSSEDIEWNPADCDTGSPHEH